MRHISFNNGAKVPVVPVEWLPATATATELAYTISDVWGLAVKVGPGFAANAGTAMYTPHLGTIEVDSNVMLPGVRPDDVLLGDALFRARHPLFMGALAHEAAHARYTRMVPADLIKVPGMTRQMVDVLVLLEESRIEKRMREHYPQCAQWLPAIVFDLLGKDFKISDTPYGAAASAALVLARVDARTITKAQAEPFRKVIGMVLDDDTLDTLRGLWCEYHALPFTQYGSPHYAEMLSIASRWLEALDMDPASDAGEDVTGTSESTKAGEESEESKGKGSGSGSGKGSGKAEQPTEAGEEDADDADADADESADEGEGSDADDDADDDADADADKGKGKGKGSGEDAGEGDDDADAGAGEGDDEGDDEHKGFSDKIKDAADRASHDQNMKSAEKIGNLKAQRRAAQRAAEAARRRKGERASKEAYEDHEKPSPEDIATGKGSTASASVLRHRKPDAGERGAAAIFAKSLSRVLVTDRRKIKTMSDVPGGRLKMRGAMARSAQRATGQQPSAEQWRHARTVTTDEPKLRIGLLTDISGSMSSAAQPMGSTAYIVGNAVERVGGLFASVVFGVGIHGVVRPNESIDSVPVVYPSDSWENLSQGFLALDYVLDLLDGDGVKILVLASDGRMVADGQLAFGETMMRMCEAAGVLVLHLDFTRVAAHYAGSHNTRMGNKTPLVDVHGKSPKEVAEILGDTLVKQVQAYYAGRATS